jgi:hypothetical protein
LFEDRLLRRISGPKRDEITGECKKLHNEELNNLYSSPNTDRVIKSRRMRWAGYVVRIGNRRGVHRVFVGNMKERDQGIDGRIMLRRIFRKWHIRIWTASSWLRIGTGVGQL